MWNWLSNIEGTGFEGIFEIIIYQLNYQGFYWTAIDNNITKYTDLLKFIHILYKLLIWILLLKL